MKEMHLICNAHIDPIWQWDWPEGASATLSTFYSAVKLSDQFDYIFCHNEVTVYKYVEEYAPELFARIQELVKAGKWHIMGGWYLQPDCNIPAGESFVRQIREGQRYFKEKFGVCPTTAINFDPFGHTVGLVQIIKKCGQDSYMFMRPYTSECALPSEQFIWRGLDGSEIKATRTGPYSSSLGKSAELIKGRAEQQPFSVGAVLWGVGNHGGGPSAKDLGDIERELMTSDEIKYIHSTPEEFFSKIAPTEVFDGSLHISMPGCYTSMHSVKKRHAMLEGELYLAEKMATVAYASGAMDRYPEDELRVATHDLLNAEFHDILPGTSIKCGEEAGIRFLDHGLLEAEKVKIRAFFALSAAQKPAGEGEYPIVIFNPHPYRINQNVECEFMLADQNWSDDIESSITVLDENGEPADFQVIKEESNLNLDWRKRIIINADLRPLELTRYSVYVEYKNKKQTKKAESLVFDNGHKRVEIDEKTGLLKTYRIDGVDYVKNGFELVSFDDNEDPWAMGADQLRRVGVNERAFALSSAPDGVFKGMKSIQITEDGDIYLGVEAFFEQDNTRARIAYKIYKNNDDVDVDVDVYMGDINRIVKLKLPLLASGELIGQTAFGTQRLFTDARENVAHRFIAIDGEGKRPVLMNKDVYGSHYENQALYMSLVRGVTYCAHPIAERALVPSDKFTKKMDQGECSFSFRLSVADRAHLEKKAQEFTQKPYALNVFPVPTEKRERMAFDVRIDNESVCCAAIKKADGREAVIFRLLNNTDQSTSAEFYVNGAKLYLSFGRFEVKTVVWENGQLVQSNELII